MLVPKWGCKTIAYRNVSVLYMKDQQTNAMPVGSGRSFPLYCHAAPSHTPIKQVWHHIHPKRGNYPVHSPAHPMDRPRPNSTIQPLEHLRSRCTWWITLESI